MLECINPATAPRIATFPLLSHLSPLSPPLSDRAHTRKSRRRPSPLSSLSRTPASPQITPPATPHPDRGSPPPSCYRAAPYQKIQGRQNRSLNRRPTSPPCPPPARGALLQPENTVAPEKVPLWHCSRSARWYAFRVFFFLGGGQKSWGENSVHPRQSCSWMSSDFIVMLFRTNPIDVCAIFGANFMIFIAADECLIVFRANFLIFCWFIFFPLVSAWIAIETL